MGFLERMVCDLVKQSTGYNPRKLVRSVGGKNILMAGAGAALAGGLMTAFNQQQAQAGQAPSHPGQAPPPPPGVAPNAYAGTPPPPPPPPMAAGTAPVPPPPPPIAAAPPPPAAEVTPPEAEADELPDPPPEISYAIVRAMVGAALADGHLSAEEKEMIHKHLGDSNLGEAQTRQIHQDLVLPPSPTDLATETTDPTVREAAYRFASLVILADQEVNDLERRWLDRLAEAYRLGAERKVELEAELFGA